MSDEEMKPMYEVIRDKCDLAIIYAEDGAYESAARVLKEVAKITSLHSKRVQRMMEELQRS